MKKYKEYVMDKKASRVIIVTDVHNRHLEWFDTPTEKRTWASAFLI